MHVPWAQGSQQAGADRISACRTAATSTPLSLSLRDDRRAVQPHTHEARARSTCAVLAMDAMDQDRVVLSLYKHAQRLRTHPTVNSPGMRHRLSNKARSWLSMRLGRQLLSAAR